MKNRNSISTLFLMIFISGILSLYSADQAQENQKGRETIIIPKEIKEIFKEGIKKREPLLNIPFTILSHIYLPARENIHTVFLFNVKNKDLGFAPAGKKEGASHSGKEGLLSVNAHVFLQFNRMEDNMPHEIIQEVYIPLNLELESSSYDPEKEEIYFTAYPLPPGNYLLSMAIASLNLDKIGTQYFEFTLPNFLSSTEKIETTPIFFVRSFKKMDSPETTATIHRGYFTYSILEIEPVINNIFSSGDNLDIFFFIYGVQPNTEGRNDIEINYEVHKGEEKVIQYQTAHYETPLISQPLPLKRTVLIKTEEQEERRETRNIEQGNYSLIIKIKDNVSGKSSEKSVDFEVR